MSVIVTDDGFASDDWQTGFAPLTEFVQAPQGTGLDLTNDTDFSDLPRDLAQIGLIRVAFPKSSDGRGFTLARRLRLAGYSGRLRAYGHVLADQYTMARRVGFDEVEISDELAARQPAEQWAFRADWRAHDYQSRLKG